MDVSYNLVKSKFPIMAKLTDGALLTPRQNNNGLYFTNNLLRYILLTDAESFRFAGYFMQIQLTINQ